MYRIIGADGREYGPISDVQVRQWIAEGRANALTKALVEGSSEWKALCDIPEFSGIFTAAAASAPAPAAAPQVPTISTGDPAADAIGREILERDYTLDIGACISRAWELVKGRFWLTVGAAAEMVGLSYRQTRRVWRRYQAQGDAGLVHRARGRPSPRRTSPALRARCLARYRER